MAIQLRGGNQLLDAVKILEQGGIKGGYVVADLGCGTSGHFVFPSAHLVGPKGKVYAVDVLKSALQAIDSRTRLEGVDNVEAVWSDLERANGLKIAPGTVDLTLLLNILALVKDKETVVREAARITKSSGTLVVSDWKSGHSPLGPPSEKRLVPEEIKRIVQSAGFEFVREFEAGQYHFGMVFIKT